MAARLNYLAVDRMDIQYAAEEAARRMSRPRASDWGALHKIGRYLAGKPRLVMTFPWQSLVTSLTTYTDSDWAGCPVTARSTSGGIVSIGSHVIKSYSRQQRVVALSSAEAELYAMVAASAESLAIIAYARDLGVSLGGEVYTDSAAALGITHRAGIGKVRHLRTQGLWVQEVRVAGRLHYKKVLGTKNPSDVLTKHVPGELLERHLEVTGAEPRGGRVETAPELNSVESMLLWINDNGDEDYDAVDMVNQPGGGCDVADLLLKSNTELKPPGKTKVVRFSKQIHYRAIPATGRCKPTRAKRKATWPGKKEPRRSTVTKWPARSPRQGDELPAQGEISGGYDELDISPVQSQGEMRRAMRQSTCSSDGRRHEEHPGPGGAGNRISWADATDKEYGP